MPNTSTLSFPFTPASPAVLSDHDLLDATVRAAGEERRTTAELLALLSEVDARRLYLGEGYSSLFTYCTRQLHLSESAAYSRITAARAARRFPILLALLSDGEVTLSAISLLAAHLTDDNCEALLDAARHASKRDVERLVASLHAQPDIPSSTRRIPAGGATREPDQFVATAGQAHETPTALLPQSGPRTPLAHAASSPSLPSPSTAPVTRRPVVAALDADRYLLRVTISASTHAKLERARDLLRHAIPNGDASAILDRALAILVEQLERRKTGRVSRQPPVGPAATPARRRHLPAAVKRVVWTRDHGRCAFVGSRGRCSETAFLEYHHVVPYASGGATDAENLELRCRAHNAYEAAVFATL